MGRSAGPALVAIVLAGAALTGHLLAGPPSSPALRPVPGCPAVLGDAVPVTGPSSTYVVPWGPVNARVCGYDAAVGAVPAGAPRDATAVLDATASAELAGLFHQLPAPARGCPSPAGPADLVGDVAIVVFGYRPGATPTVGGELTVMLSTAAVTGWDGGTCRVLSNGFQTRSVPDGAARRIAELVPALGPALGQS